MVVVYRLVVNFMQVMPKSRSMSGILIIRTSLFPWVAGITIRNL